jgi:hypothetical protein
MVSFYIFGIVVSLGVAISGGSGLPDACSEFDEKWTYSESLKKHIDYLESVKAMIMKERDELEAEREGRRFVTPTLDKDFEAIDVDSDKIFTPQLFRQDSEYERELGRKIKDSKERLRQTRQALDEYKVQRDHKLSTALIRLGECTQKVSAKILTTRARIKEINDWIVAPRRYTYFGDREWFAKKESDMRIELVRLEQSLQIFLSAQHYYEQKLEELIIPPKNGRQLRAL